MPSHFSRPNPDAQSTLIHLLIFRDWWINQKHYRSIFLFPTFINNKILVMWCYFVLFLEKWCWRGYQELQWCPPSLLRRLEKIFSIILSSPDEGRTKISSNYCMIPKVDSTLMIPDSKTGRARESRHSASQYQPSILAECKKKTENGSRFNFRHHFSWATKRGIWVVSKSQTMLS